MFQLSQLYNPEQTRKPSANMRSVIFVLVAAFGFAALIDVTISQTSTTTTGVPPVCVNGTQFQCESGKCLPINWLCDGELDCPDGDDETPERCPCDPDEYVCADGQCIPERGRCDNVPNCRDGTDEHYCPCPGPEEDYWRCGGVGACIELDWRCDGVQDCVDNSDEENCTSIATPNEASLLRKIPGKFLLRH